MLNELSQVLTALERVGLVPVSRHPRINPMGKNRVLLIVRLDDQGKPSDAEFIAGESAAALLRVQHGSCCDEPRTSLERRRETGFGRLGWNQVG